MFTRIFSIFLFSNFALTLAFSVLYFNDIASREEQKLVNSAKNIMHTAEIIKDSQVELTSNGIIDLAALKNAGDMEKVRMAIPILRALNATKTIALSNNFTLKTPNFFKRAAPEKQLKADPSVLSSLQSASQESISTFDRSNNTFTYFKPIQLSADCLICHGGTPEETDIVGFHKEGFKVGDVVGYFEITSKLDSFNQSILSALINIVIIAFSLFVTTTLLFYFYLRGQKRPLQKILEAIKKAESGNLIVEKTSLTNDEFGQINSSWNRFITQLNSLLKETQTLSENSQSGSSILLGSAHEITQSGINISSGVLELSRLIGDLESEITMTTKSTNDLNSFLQTLENLVVDQTRGVVTSSETVEIIAQSIQAIADTSEKKIAMSKDLEKKANEGIAILRTTMAKIAKTADSTQEIIEMTEVIQKIAAQTSILAMNAAIEASHAGEAGRGFAVVADEIRNLSDSASASAKRITLTVNEISENTEDTRVSSEETVGRFNEIGIAITSVAQSLMDLELATQQLSAGAKKILSQNQLVLDGGETIKESSSSVKIHTLGIVRSMEKITGIAQTSRTHFKNIETLVRSLGDMSSAIITLGGDTGVQMNALQNTLRKFTLDANENNKKND